MYPEGQVSRVRGDFPLLLALDNLDRRLVRRSRTYKTSYRVGAVSELLKPPARNDAPGTCLLSCHVQERLRFLFRVLHCLGQAIQSFLAAWLEVQEYDFLDLFAGDLPEGVGIGPPL